MGILQRCWVTIFKLCTCVCAPAEGQLSLSSSGTPSTCATGPLIWSWTVKWGWLVSSSRGSPVSLPFAWVLVNTLRFWHLQGKHFTNWPFSPAPVFFFFKFYSKEDNKASTPSLWLLGVCLNYYGLLWRCSVKSVALAEVNAVLTARLVSTSSCVQPLNRVAPLPFFLPSIFACYKRVIFIYFKIFILLCVCTRVHLYSVCGCPWRPEGVTGSCDPWQCGCWEPNCSPLQEQQILLTVKISLYPSTFFFFKLVTANGSICL